MPLPHWRFQMTYAASQINGRLSNQSPVARLVRRGQIVAGGGGSNMEEGGTASGVRQPRSPPEPVLSGQAARPLPNTDAPDTDFWRS